MILIAGIGSAAQLNVDLVSQYNENTHNTASITNAVVTQGQNFVSHLGGSIANVVVAGNYAYLGQGQDILVLDITDVSKPLEVGRVTTTSVVNNIAVSGNYAYVANGQNGLVVVDVTNPAAPTITGTYTSGYAYGVAVSGNYVYVANGNNGLVVVDITNPAAPTPKGSYATAGSATGIAVSGNYAYIADGQNGLMVVDITNPAAPTLAGSYDTTGTAVGIAVSGNYAYIADGQNGLVVVDITNPAAPTPKGSYATAGSTTGIAVSGNYAYVADGENGIVILDITNPAALTPKGSYDTAGNGFGIAVSGNYAYVADGRSGLLILNVSNPLKPTSAGIYDISGYASGVSVSGDYAYIANGYMGLTVLNIANPAAPTGAGRYITTGYARDVTVSGNYAYVADGQNGLVIVDITNPAAPTPIGSYDTAGYSWGVTVSGNYAYMADGMGGLVIVDITTPAAPKLKGIYDTAGNAENVAISGSYAYVADGDNGLVILDIANPAAPSLVGSYSTHGHAYGIAVIGNNAYIADGSNGLVVVDIANPATPKLAGSYDTAGSAENIAISGNYAYIADDSNGLVIVDITNPAAPTLAGGYNTPGYGYGVTVSGNYVYVADFNNGLVILHVDSASNVSDTTPPAPVTNLNEIGTGSSWIRWTWANPTDVDFKDVMIYIDGTFITSTSEGFYNSTGLAEGSTHIISTKTVDTSGNINPTWVNDSAIATSVTDTIPPASVTNLNETSTGSSWIRWTWINPTDVDFKDVMIYIDGAFATNTSEGFYNSTGLVEGSTHTISTKTVDISGNINPTWVNDSATAIPALSTDTIPPASATNLKETGVGPDWTNWTWNNPLDADFSHVMVYIDGAFITNTADSSINYYNATGLSDGATHTISIQTVDTSGNINPTWVNDSAAIPNFPKVSGVSGTDITKTSITLTWEASNDTTRVQISRDDMILGNVNGSNSYVDSNLTSSKTYIYTLVPYNKDGLEGKAVSVSLRTKSSSGSSGGGSSGSSSKSSSSGGGAGSASVENYANLAMKDVDSEYLKMNSNVTYQFTKEGNPIQSISFYSLKNSGQITSTVEVLNNRSRLANSTPEGSIYKYVNIWVGKAGFATAANIKDAQVKFKVNSSWIQQMGVSSEDVKLQRYNGTAWEVLPTTMQNNAVGYVIYESHTPGFSPFAITAEKELASPANGNTNEESNGQSNVNSNVTSPTKETKTPGFEALFAVTCLIAVAYLFRRN